MSDRPSHNLDGLDISLEGRARLRRSPRLAVSVPRGRASRSVVVRPGGRLH